MLGDITELHGFSIGDTIQVTGEFEGNEFTNDEAIIYAFDFTYAKMVTLYFPNLEGYRDLHSDAMHAYNELVEMYGDAPYGLQPPDGYANSWNVPHDWLLNGNIQPLSSIKSRPKHWKVINKIKQIEAKRKQLGYTCYN